MTPEEIAKKFPNVVAAGGGLDGLRYSDLGVLRSAAGYYLGRTCWDEYGSFEEPYSRESAYFKTHADAMAALTGGFVIRDCIENQHAYAVGDLPTLPKRKPVDA